MLRVAVVFVSFLCLFLTGQSDVQDSSPGALSQRASSTRLLELGEATYVKKCVACHGLEGRGDGEAAYLLYPKPRDFVAARYRLVSTWDGVPTDAYQ